MYLEVFADNPYATNCWLLAREGSDEALVVDPGFFPERVEALLRAAGKRPVAALATHGHSDHVGSARELCDGASIPLYIHSADRLALTDSVAWGAGYPTPPCDPKDVRTFEEGDVIDLAGLRIGILHTPGHTPGSSCLRVEGLEATMFFSGDLVFRGSIGRHDFPNSSPEDMAVSLKRFLALDDGLDVYPGHGGTTTVGRERAANPFLRGLA
jgi:hydroxyacylglutathione hydrolase